jgi:phosphatidylinositol alpha-1,6-mannosyltransferase
VTTTDVPVVALMLLSLALAERRDRAVSGAAALGLACAMKPTAWPAVPVVALVLWRRDGAGAALRFAGIAAGLVLAATVPAIVADPAAMADNTILFPLGLTRHLTPAGSLMPGDLLARFLPDGHAVAVALIALAALAFAAWLIRRPPSDLRAATWRLALGLALLFALGPAERFGYFVYPLALAGWLFLARLAPAAGSVTRTRVPPPGAPTASTVPPWPRTTSLTTDSPSPEPGTDRAASAR